MLPTGTVTFLMTDIEGSTRAWERRPEALTVAVPRHYDLLDEAISASGGVRPIEQGEGDSVVAAFSRATDAVGAALTAQRMLVAEAWTDGIALPVRMALHTGEAQLRDEGNYLGMAITRCARLRSCAHGGQVLLSDVTAALIADQMPDGVGLADLGRHRLRDLGRPERVWQLLHPDLEAEFPPLRSLDAFRHNLPLQLTPLVGRRAEVADVVALLAEERLVTLTGSGGVGKTRLALAVGAELVAEFPGGVWFVELGGTSGVGSVGRATLKSLGVPETPGVPPAEVAAAEFGSGGRSLVILDNCEHLISECDDFVVTVLGACPNVSVLATSREQLGVDGEIAWRVPSLLSPPQDRPLPVATWSQYDAFNLFVDRARRARPSFTVTEANAAAIAQTCHRLDGIPLAVELAAARCRHLSVERIMTELDDRFRLLTGGSRMVMPRQQTLAASVEWSYDLLDDGERRVLRRLGVFAGPFPLQAAEAVVETPGDVDPITVFDSLIRLVDKSLVLADDPDGASQYRLLETIRAFAVDRAREAGELAELRDAHAAWWCDRLEELGVTGPTDDVIEMVDANHDDLVAALWWVAGRDPDLGLRLLWPLARAFQGTGRAGDALPAFDSLLTPAVEQQHPQRWLRAALSASIPVFGFRGPQAFVELLARCEARALDLEDDYGLALARWLLGMSVATDRELIRVGREHGQPYAVALATVRLAIDAALDEPDAAPGALRDADAAASSYRSRYIREYARSAHGEQALVFGRLAEVIDVGYQIVHSATRPIQAHGFWMLLTGGLLSRDEAAVTAACDAARRDAARQVPGSDQLLGVATSYLALLRDRARRGTVVRRLPVSILGWRHATLSTAAPVDGADRRPTRCSPGARRSRPSPTPSPVSSTAMKPTGTKRSDWPISMGCCSSPSMRSRGSAQRRQRPTAPSRPSDCSQPPADCATKPATTGASPANCVPTTTRWVRRKVTSARQLKRHGRKVSDSISMRPWPSPGERAVSAAGPVMVGPASPPPKQRVVKLVAEGLTNPEIAAQLLMARGTVKTHLEHVYAKTGHRNRAELAVAVT